MNPFFPVIKSLVKNPTSPKILAIETSCDETAVAVVSGMRILSNSVYSQLELHQTYGGVVPEIARIAHLEKFDSVLNQALNDAKVLLEDIDVVAVTYGPGLAIALEVGILKAKELATQLKIPLIVVNHMEGHLFSAFTKGTDEEQLGKADFQFPALGLLVSGGHTEFVLVKGFGQYEKIGQTLDDACGEAFDKAAKMLGLGYPGGPIISRLAEEGRGGLKLKLEKNQQKMYVRGYAKGKENSQSDFLYELPVPMAFSGDLNLSYSGLKTALKQVVNKLSKNSGKLNIRETGESEKLSEQQVKDLAAMFEETALQILKIKLDQTLTKYPEVKEVWLGGGVIANDHLREMLKKLANENGVVLRYPVNRKLMTDNAGMIGIVASLKLEDIGLIDSTLDQEKKEQLKQKGIYVDTKDFDEIDRDPGLSL